MALRRRLKNMMFYGRWARLKAALGLLSSEDRRRWVSTIPAGSLIETAVNQVYPWYSFNAIDFLSKTITPDMEILEYGGGYSTLWWAGRTARVTTIERSQRWFEEINLAFASHGITNVRLLHCSDIPESTEKELRETAPKDRIDELVRKYLSFCRLSHSDYDAVVIDDIFRNEVIAEYVSRIRPGGLLILDDSEREEYISGIEMLNKLNWASWNFWGPTPYHFHEKQTSIWRKPEATV